MNKERLMRILLAPHVSEKSTRVADQARQYVFRVLPDARKPEIRKAVELLFNVQVDRVTTTSIRGKRKAFGRVRGTRPAIKKAYVTLQPGHDIDFLGTD